MTTPKILFQDGEDKPNLPTAGKPAFGWVVLGWVGLVFVVVACFDWVVIWYPLPFGQADWEFRCLTRTYDSLPLPTIGFAFSLGAGLVLGRRWIVVLVAACMLIVALGLAVVGFRHVMYLMDNKVPFGAMADPPGLKRLAQGLLYPIVYVGLAIQGLGRGQARH